MEAAIANETRLRRDPAHGLIAGVLAGFAQRLQVDPVILRVAFAIAVVATGGLALIAYAAAWLWMPATDGRPAPIVKTLGGVAVGSRWRVAAGVSFLMLGALLVFRELGIWWSDALVWPLILAAGGAALLWRAAPARATSRSAGRTARGP